MKPKKIKKTLSSEDEEFSIYFTASSDWMTQRTIVRRQIHEPEVTEYLLQNLKPGMTFLDVGAGIGWFTLIGAHKVKSEGQVLAYEPMPSRFEVLRENIKLNGFKNVQCFSLALSDREGRLYMGGRWHMRLISRKTDIPTKTISLDSHFKTLDLENVDVVKIDVEGGELAVLYGMEQTIKNNLDIRIVCEVHKPMMLGSGNKKRLFSFMSKLGLETREIRTGTNPHWVFYREE